MNKIEISKYSTLIDQGMLSIILSDYKRVNDKISVMIKSGELIPLMRGKYLSGDAYKAGIISPLQIANILYGPSYVSSFTSLSFHGWIPERVSSIESSTTLRSKTIENEVGRFEYQKVNKKMFHLGITYLVDDNNGFLIASPTKSLIDVLCSGEIKYIYGLKTLEEYIFENLRIDEFEFMKLDEEVLNQCIEIGHKKRLLTLLLSLFKSYKNGYA